MLRRSKGSALVVALMVVIIISITAAGLIFVATQQRRMVAGETAQTRLFYAAESGMAIAVKRLRVMTMDQFINPTADDKVLVSNIPDIEINGCTVDLTSTWNSTDDYWTLTAVATDENSKKTCTITLDKIQCQAFTDNSVTISEDMPRSVQFVGVDPTNTTYYQPNDMLLGNLFFGGMINVLRDPIFEGVVKSSSSKKSIRSIADTYAADANTNSDATGLTDMQRLMASSKYANGIWDLSDLSEDADAMKTRYSKIFPDGYTGNSGTIDKTKDVVATFDDVKNLATRPSAVKNPYIVTVGANDNVNVKIEEGYITVTPIPAGWESTNGKKPFNASNNAILFDGDRTENNRIAIKESVISGNLTVMSKSVDIEILGDIKYKEIVNPYNSAVSGYDYPYVWANSKVNGIRTGNNINNLAKTLQTNNVQSMFGCVSETGNIWLGKELCSDMNDIKGVTLLSGVFYAPNGKFGIRESTDNGAAKFGTINTSGTVTSQNGWYEGQGNWVLTRIVVIGSAMMKSVGKFRQLPGDGAHYEQVEKRRWVGGFFNGHWEYYYEDVLVGGATDTRGFEGAFCNDYRFSEDGMFPALFKPVKDSNGWWFNTDNAVWSYSYGVCSN